MLWMLAAAPVAFLAAWLFDRRRRVYADLGTTPAAAVGAGRNEVKGRAWHPVVLSSHLTQTPSVWWTYRLEEERTHTRTVTTTDGKGHTSTRTETYTEWHEIDSAADAHDSVFVVDDSGSVEVCFAGASLTPGRRVQNVLREPDGRGFWEKLLTADNRTGRYRESEQVLAIGDELFVVGDASMPDDAPVPRIDHGSPFVISTRSEASHRGRAGAAVPVFVLLGLGLTIGGAQAIDHPAAVPLAVAVVVALVLAATVVIVFNQLQLLVQQAARAWSLIDVQLARRHDLVPRLEAVARAALDHERATFEAAAVARSSIVGVVPDQATIDRADTEIRVQTEQLTRLLAVVEDHPTLRTGETMVRLQAELADTENRLAGARTFYNESVTLLHDRRGTFPGMLVARWADPRAFVLFGAEGFARTVPKVTYDFGPTG